MPHTHPVVDSDPHFKIDKTTRAIVDQSTIKTVIMQGDHNSEKLTFELPRYVDGHDMSLCDKVEIHYSNTDAATRAANKGVYLVEDLKVNTSLPEEVVTFSWLISSAVTQNSGPLSFLIRFACTENGKVLYAWNTGIYKDQTIGMSMYNSDTIAKEFPDIFAQIKSQIDGKLDKTGYIPNKFLGTDYSGTVVEMDPPAGGVNPNNVKLLYNGTIEVTQPVGLITADSLVSMKGLKRVLFKGHIAENTNPNIIGSTMMSIEFGDLNISYGRFTDGRKYTNFLGIIDLFGKESLFSITKMVNNNVYNVGTPFNGASLYVSLPNYNQIKIATFNDKYQGSIKLEAYGEF